MFAPMCSVQVDLTHARPDEIAVSDIALYSCLCVGAHAIGSYSNKSPCWTSACSRRSDARFVLGQSGHALAALHWVLPFICEEGTLIVLVHVTSLSLVVHLDDVALIQVRK